MELGKTLRPRRENKTRYKRKRCVRIKLIMHRSRAIKQIKKGNKLLRFRLKTEELQRKGKFKMGKNELPISKWMML